MTVKDSNIIVQVDTDTIVLVGNPDGYVVTATDETLKDKFNRNIKTNAMVPVIPGEPHRLFRADNTTMIGLVAAMIGTNPGQATLIEAPEAVWAILSTENTINALRAVN